MPSWAEFQPYIVTGLALGGLYALSGVGLVVLYRATGVLYLAFGAVGAMGAFIAYSIIQAGDPGWVAWITCIVFGGVVTLRYGMVLGPGRARPARPVHLHAGPRARALRGHRPRVADDRRPVAVDLVPDRQQRVHGRTAPGQLDAGHRARPRCRDHGRHRRVPALLQAGHRDAG